VALPIDLASIEVIDAVNGGVVRTLMGPDLASATSLLSGGDPISTLPPASAAVVWFDLAFDSPDRIPAAIEHRLTTTFALGSAAPTTIVQTGGRTAVDRRSPVVLSPPLRGSNWAALGSCCDGPHRRGLYPIDGVLYLSQRFAIDFNLLGADQRIVAGEFSRNENHYGYGQPVYAVADATVIEAVDRFENQVPGAEQTVTLDEQGGNHLILDLGDGRFAFYGHLKPGSVLVRTGERVRRGQRVAELGNSGGSHGAHLHFHLMDGPSFVAADGLPYVFDRFDLQGRTPPLAEVVTAYEEQEPIPIDTQGAGPRRDALPLGRDVVAFPDALLLR
jgi:murein DD-endopeptidase MepM/ murein hydrolase activator NlpD